MEDIANLVGQQEGNVEGADERFEYLHQLNRLRIRGNEGIVAMCGHEHRVVLQENSELSKGTQAALRRRHQALVLIRAVLPGLVLFPM